MRKVLNYAILLLVLAALIVGGYVYWLHEQRYPGTDDAYIQAHVIDIAPQINGQISKIFVKNQQHVKKNQLLFTIDPTPFDIAYKKAEADLENTLQAVSANQQAVLAADAVIKQRQAQLINAEKSSARIMPLVKKGFYPKSAGDDAIQQLAVAKQALIAARNEREEAQAKLGKPGDANASIQAAKAGVAQAKLNLTYTKVTAPADGHLAKFNLQPGQTVTAYQPLFTLVDDHTWWATANMKETDLSRIRSGQKAVIHVDMYPSHVFHGIVTSISPGSGASFALLPPENASGNWVKVIQRFPVKITIPKFDPKFPLRIGASCTVSIDTTT